MRSARVYPRVCGGTALDPLTGNFDVGLSPRVRGNPAIDFINRGSSGSIPACAGEPFLNPYAQRKWRVYPRVCGGTCGGCVAAR